MRTVASLFKLFLLLAIVGFAVFGIYNFAIKDKVKDETPEQRECKKELGAVKDAIKQATEARKINPGLDTINPAEYIHIDFKYYTFTVAPSGFGWVPQPIGTPPCTYTPPATG